MKKLRFLTLAVICSFSLNAQQVESIVSESWSDNAWENSSKSSFSYNVDDTPSELLMAIWSVNDWMDMTKSIYGYDANGNTINMTTQMNMGGSWMNTQVANSTFNSDNLIVETIAQITMGGTDLNSGRITYTYDSDDNNTITIGEAWDLPTTSWVNSSKTISTFNSDNLITETVSQSWDNGWVNSAKSIATYNSSNFLIETVVKSWIGSSWVNSTKNVQNLDNNNLLTLGESFTWENGSWSLTGEFMPVYNSANLASQMVFQSVDSTGVMVNASRMTLTYTNGIGLEEELAANISIYPNPSSDLLFIQLEDQGFTQINLFDMSGRVVKMSTSNNQNVSLNIHELPAGVYNLNIVKNGKQITRQIVKQ